MAKNPENLDFFIAKYSRVGVIQNAVDGTTVVKMGWGGFHMEANVKILVYNLVWEHETKYRVRKCKKNSGGGHIAPLPSKQRVKYKANISPWFNSNHSVIINTRQI